MPERPASDDFVGYRSEEELNVWKENCPIALLEELLLSRTMLTDVAKSALLKEVDAEIAEAFQFAKTSPFPKAGDWEAENYARSSPLARRCRC